MHCDQGRGCMILEQQMQNKLPIPGKTNFDWYLFYAMAKDYAGKPMCEVGIGDGGSSLTLADLTDKLDLIDSWHQTWVKEPVQDIYEQLKHPAKFIDSKSVDVRPKQVQKYKFVHLDANKAYIDVYDDLCFYSEHCTGLICVDDYLQSMWPEVTRAVDDFVHRTNWNRILIGNHQVFLCKKKETPALQDIIMNFPVVIRHREVYFTYGDLPKDKLFEKFMKCKNNKEYTWHRTAYTRINKANED